MNAGASPGTNPFPPTILVRTIQKFIKSGQAVKLGASAMRTEVNTSHNLIDYSWTHSANLLRASKTSSLTHIPTLLYMRLYPPLIIPLNVIFHKFHRKANVFGF